MVQRCRYCLLLLLIALNVVSASLPHNNYLHLVEKHRRLKDSQLPRAKSVCGGASLSNSRVWAVVKFCTRATTYGCLKGSQVACHLCHADKNAGDPIEGQYVLVFDPAKVETVSDGVSE